MPPPDGEREGDRADGSVPFVASGVVPRSREDRVPRHYITSPSVGDERFPLTCPRCGWPCRHVWPVYWDSPWNEYGGMCGQCAQEAAERFDVAGWPSAGGVPSEE